MSKKDWKKHFHRMKQIADQNLGRAEKSEVLNEDLISLEIRVNKIKTICQSTIKKLTACLPLSGSSNPDKSMKKLPESMLAMAMLESATSLGYEDTLGKMYGYCARLQNCLAREIFRYTQQVEQLVLGPMQTVLENEIPAIYKLRKHLTKLTLDMDSARGRFQSTLKQFSGTAASSSLSSKLEMLKEELDRAENRVQQCKDQLVTEMYTFLAREGQLNDVLLTLITTQIDFHRRTLESLEGSLPQMKLHNESQIHRPVFGCPLVDHLKQTDREIAFVIERCVRSLILHGINEEGLFRVASSSTKVRKLKAAFDANIVNLDDYKDDAHCVAAVLKSYLRELPEPLMTFELYNEWMHVMELPVELRQNALWVVVDKLPKPNYTNLRYIIKFLAKLASNSDINKMSPGNIAIVIGPNLLWAPGDNGPSILTAASHSAVIEYLINKSEWFFPGELDFGVIESDRYSLSRLQLDDKQNRDNPRSLSSVSSSALTPSYISKYRFFGSMFDETDALDLKLSPSDTRLSLSSLLSLNENDDSFERKYSFSSLLDDRSTSSFRKDWDSEGGSLRWPKLHRAMTSASSLNRSLCHLSQGSAPPSSMSAAETNFATLDRSLRAQSARRSPISSSSVKNPAPLVATSSTRRAHASQTLLSVARSAQKKHSADSLIKTGALSVPTTVTSSANSSPTMFAASDPPSSNVPPATDATGPCAVSSISPSVNAAVSPVPTPSALIMSPAFFKDTSPTLSAAMEAAFSEMSNPVLWATDYTRSELESGAQHDEHSMLPPSHQKTDSKCNSSSLPDEHPMLAPASEHFFDALESFDSHFFSFDQQDVTAAQEEPRLLSTEDNQRLSESSDGATSKPASVSLVETDEGLQATRLSSSSVSVVNGSCAVVSDESGQKTDDLMKPTDFSSDISEATGAPGKEKVKLKRLAKPANSHQSCMERNDARRLSIPSVTVTAPENTPAKMLRSLSVTSGRGTPYELLKSPLKSFRSHLKNQTVSPSSRNDTSFSRSNKVAPRSKHPSEETKKAADRSNSKSTATPSATSENRSDVEQFKLTLLNLNSLADGFQNLLPAKEAPKRPERTRSNSSTGDGRADIRNSMEDLVSPSVFVSYDSPQFSQTLPHKKSPHRTVARPHYPPPPVPENSTASKKNANPLLPSDMKSSCLANTNENCS